MEYSPEFKNNHQTAYLAEEYERLEKEALEARSLAEGDEALADMAREDLERIHARQQEILADIEKIVEKDKEVAA